MARKSKSETQGNRVALLREERGWTQDELGEMVYLTRRQIAYIESGNFAQVAAIIQLADIFDVSVDYLLERSDFRCSKNCDDLKLKIMNEVDMMSDFNKKKLLKHIEVERELLCQAADESA